MEIFEIKNLNYYYPETQKPALKDINLSIDEGEFILLLGKSGSGKSTLGRLFNKIVPNFYGGKISGKITGDCDVGMVFQDPEKQLVMDKVERELAFGLENLGIERDFMRKRVMETLSFLNLHPLKNRRTYELSGGEKQRVAIGSVLSMGYQFLVLDEPTSQLDPVSAEDILNIVKRINEDLGYTVILVEQRIERCFHLADRILFMEEGTISFDGTPEEFLKIATLDRPYFLPPVSTFFLEAGSKRDIPITIKEGRKKLRKVLDVHKLEKHTPNQCAKPEGEVLVRAEDLSFCYKKGKNVLDKVSLSVHRGEIFAILGESGGGKTTLLKNIAGLLKPISGKLKIKGIVGYLSQNPNDYLFNNTVYEELKYTLDQKNISDQGQINQVLKALALERYKDVNPRDLSGGERQRVALASILVMDPDILILDEPTRGLDRELKNRLGEILGLYKSRDKAVILVTHDVEFAARYADSACLLFDGSVAQQGSKYDVLTSGLYYSPQINRLFAGYRDDVLCIKEGIEFCNIREAEML